MTTTPSDREALLLRALGSDDDAVEAVLVGLRVDVTAAADLADEGGIDTIAAPLRGLARRIDLAIGLRRLERRTDAATRAT